MVYAARYSEECRDLYIGETNEPLHRHVARRSRANSSGQESALHLTERPLTAALSVPAQYITLGFLTGSFRTKEASCMSLWKTEVKLNLRPSELRTLINISLPTGTARTELFLANNVTWVWKNPVIMGRGEGHQGLNVWIVPLNFCKRRALANTWTLLV